MYAPRKLIALVTAIVLASVAGCGTEVKNPVTGRTITFNQGYPLISARLGIQSEDRQKSLEFFVENLTNQKYSPTAHSDNNISVGAPVNARLTLSTSF